MNVIGFPPGLNPLTKLVSSCIELCQLPPRLTRPPTVFCPFLQNLFTGVAKNTAVKWPLCDSMTDVLHVAFWFSAAWCCKGKQGFPYAFPTPSLHGNFHTAWQYDALGPCVDSLPGPRIACLVGRAKADPTGCNFKCWFWARLARW